SSSISTIRRARARRRAERPPASGRTRGAVDPPKCRSLEERSFVMRRPPTPAAPLLPTTPAFLRLQAARRGEAGGLVFRGRELPFGELEHAADDLARWLARRGAGAGCPVGILAGNEPGLVAALFALWGLGAVAVPISTRSTAEETARLLTHARARLLI